MSSSAPQPPDLDRVEKDIKAVTGLTNTLTEFIRLIAGMVRKRQWAALLLLFVIAVPIVFLVTKVTLGQVIKEPILDGILLVVGVVLLVGVILELRKKPPLRLILHSPSKRKAIKFLRSFEQEDVEIFARLQGYRDLGSIFESIVYPEFSFGILSGRSGCGKSSYLKAGLLAALAKTDVYRGIYIKFSNEDALVTIWKAFGESLKLPKQDIKTLSFIELLNKGIDAASQSSPNFKSLILIFDQFEQFFVHTNNEAPREAFIQALTTWYNHNDLKEKVKILVSIREDWFAWMYEIQEALNYTLRTGSQSGGNFFRLKNFSPEEAVMILTVMAQEDLGIEQDDTERFDRHYMQDMLDRELASPTDHLISPFDLQIVAETINQQNTSEMRAFNRTVLQKLGGIEGLRRSFLENILEDLGTEQKKSAVKVLVALTNLEQQARAEVQTLAQLQEKLKGSVPPDEVGTIADYLQGAGLSSVVERAGIKGYELAHEGMIDAVICLRGQVQDKAYRANQLLERRVNEWLGNNRSSRYLFNLSELWLIEKQKPYLVWRSKQQPKQRLIAQSKQRICRNFAGFWSVLLLGIVIFGCWNYTPWGQLAQIRWKLANVSHQPTKPQDQSKVAIAFAKDENFSQALKLANQIQESSAKAVALSGIAAAYGQLNQPEKAANLLQQALAIAQQIQESSGNSSAISEIVAAISKLNQPEKAANLLQQALAIAQQIQESSGNSPWYSDKARALSDTAAAYGQLNQPEKAANLIQQALAVAQQSQESSDKAFALSGIAAAYGQLNQLEKAVNLLQQTLAVAQQIQEPSSKASAISEIVAAISKLNQPEKAANLLQQALAVAQQIQEPSDSPPWYSDKDHASSDKARVLSDIAATYSKLNQPEKAANLLQQALAVTQQIQESFLKAIALDDVATAISKLNQPEKAANLLQQALAVVQQIQEPSDKASAISEIVAAISKLNQPEKAASLLQQALAIVQQIQESYDKASPLSEIAAAEANLENWGQALTVTQQCPSQDCEVVSLSGILAVHAEQRHPELKVKEEEELSGNLPQGIGWNHTGKSS